VVVDSEFHPTIQASLVDVDAVKAISRLDNLMNAITATSMNVFGTPKWASVRTTNDLDRMKALVGCPAGENIKVVQFGEISTESRNAKLFLVVKSPSQKPWVLIVQG
jgi:hypothetical protein